MPRSARTGRPGEEAEKSGFDSTAWWARSGLMDMVRADHEAAPARSAPGMGDHPSAMALFGAIATALYRRERSGAGGVVHTSLLANGLWANGFFAQAALCGATFHPRPPRDQVGNAVTNTYRTRDDRWFILSMLNEERQFRPFCAALGRPALADDPRFASIPARRANARGVDRGAGRRLRRTRPRGLAGDHASRRASPSGSSRRSATSRMTGRRTRSRRCARSPGMIC